MRRAFIALSAAAALSLSVSAASAQAGYYDYYGYGWQPNAAPVAATGAVVGTLAGVGLANGWWGNSAFATSLGATTAGSAVAGGVIGIGAAGLIHVATTPCVGFDALLSPFRPGPSGCVNGQFVGYQPVARGPRY